MYSKTVVKKNCLLLKALSYCYSSLAGKKSELLLLVAAVPVYLLVLFSYKKLGQQLISGCCFTCSE